MEIRTQTQKYAKRNTIAFDKSAHDATVARQLTEGLIASAKEHTHTAAGCTSRDKDKSVTTIYYGVETIAEEEHVVTGSFSDSASVVEPTEQEKGDWIGQDTLLRRLQEIKEELTIIGTERQGLLRRLVPSQTRDALKAEETRLLGMLR